MEPLNECQLSTHDELDIIQMIESENVAKFQVSRLNLTIIIRQRSKIFSERCK